MLDYTTIQYRSHQKQSSGKMDSDGWWTYEEPVDPRRAQEERIAEVNAALAFNLGGMRDAFLDIMIAVLTIIIGLCSFIHGTFRFIYNLIGLVVWSWGVFLMALHALKAKLIAQSSSSVFDRRDPR